MDEIERAVATWEDKEGETRETLAEFVREQCRNALRCHQGFDIGAIRKERADAEPQYGDDMAKIATVTGGLDMGCAKMEESRCLYDLASKVEEGVIVEIGSWKGRSTVALALGSMAGHGVPVYSVDPHALNTEVDIGAPWHHYGPHDLGDWMEAILRFELWEIVRPVQMYSDEFFYAWCQSNYGKIGLLWIDASHEFTQTHFEAMRFRHYLTPDAPIVFDDYNVTGVRKVCDELEDIGWKIQPWGAKMAVAWQPTS